MEARDAGERRTIQIALAINSFMFVAEFVLGWIAESTGLIADSLDMLADASVYAIALLAVGKGPELKVKAAITNGGLQVVLASSVLIDVVRRFLYGSEPVSALMMGVGVVALVANCVCLALIFRHRDGGVHMRALVICSSNDVLANLGVILSGGLVWATGNRYPDLAIGLIIAAVVLHGGARIIAEARAQRAQWAVAGG
mgnify:CR=1 FL=1